MTGMKTMKRSTLLSVIAIALCFVMLFGATWAWFSDTVLNAGNKIATGKFDADLELKNEDEWVSVDNAAAVFDCQGWMPGDSVAKVFRVVNKEAIALDWSAALIDKTEVVADAASLAEVIDVYYIAYEAEETGYATDIAGATRIGTLAECMEDDALVGTIGGENLAQNGTQAFAIVLVMQDTAGSDYEDLNASFDIEISAIQANAN